MGDTIGKTPAIGVRRRALLSVAAALPIAAPTILRAQGRWRPDRPITVYNPLPGGVTDAHLRLLSQTVQKKLGQPLVVDLKPGASATLAAAQVVGAKPDGHTLAVMTANSLRLPQYQPMAWNPIRDFTYVAGLSAYVFGIVVRADSPWKTLNELIEDGKRNPDKFNYGTSGIGTTGHLMMIETELATGSKFTLIPYKGGPEWIQALLGGHIDFVPDGTTWAPFVESGKLRVLAMATQRRLPQFPQAPTLIECGINVVAQSPYGIVGPKGLPPEIATELADAFKEGIDAPGHQAFLDNYMQEAWYRDPAQYRAWADKYYVDVKPLLEKAGLIK